MLGILHTTDEARCQLLQVPVVTHRECLHDGGRCHERPEDRSCLGSHNLGAVRVLFLRHDRTRGAERIIEIDKPDKGRTPEDEILAEAAHRDHEEAEVCQDFQGEVAGGNSIHGISDDTVKPEQICGVLPVDGKAGRRKSRSTEG